MTDRLVLALDGSTRACGAALLRLRNPAECGRPGEGGWETVCRRVDLDGRGQARILLRLVDEMLGELGAVPRIWGQSWWAPAGDVHRSEDNRGHGSGAQPCYGDAGGRSEHPGSVGRRSGGDESARRAYRPRG